MKTYACIIACIMLEFASPCCPEYTSGHLWLAKKLFWWLYLGGQPTLGEIFENDGALSWGFKALFTTSKKSLKTPWKTPLFFPGGGPGPPYRLPFIQILTSDADAGFATKQPHQNPIMFRRLCGTYSIDVLANSSSYNAHTDHTQVSLLGGRLPT